MADELSLAELAAASGLQPRTIRSWVAQGLLPSPLNRGPMARYPAETLERLLAVRAMREVLRRPLAEIRQELLVATPDTLHELADKAKGLSPEPIEPGPATRSTALEYIRRIREGAASPTILAPSVASPPAGFEALEHQLGGDRASPARKARAEEWLRLPVTPDVELTVRGPLDPEARARLERCADLIRNILLGRNR